VATAPTAAQARPLRVLFIGNSYTYFNDLPGLVASLARGARPSRAVHTEMVAQPGASLRDHWLDGAALAAIRRTRWDAVVLQEQSMLGVMLVHGRPTVNDPDQFHAFGRRFIREITAAGATPVLYLTWARRPTPDTQDRLTRAYAALAAATGARLAPVGVAWQQARAQRPALELFDPDGTHPSPAGSYLAAATLLATITGTPARALPAVASGRVLADSFRLTYTGAVAPLVTLPDSDAAFLQRQANDAIAAVRTLPTAPVTGARLPPLPAGTPPTWHRLAGAWTGTMRLFDAPVTVTLTVTDSVPRPQLTWREVGGGWSAASTVADAALDSAGLTFTVSDPRFLAPDERHRAVLTGDSLVGHAEVGSAMQVPRLLGSWSLRRAGATVPDPTVTEHPTGAAAALFGLAAPAPGIVWAAGTRGTVLRSLDGGATWTPRPIPNAEGLQFRDVEALGPDTAWVLAIGNGPASRLYFTATGGSAWTEQFRNADSSAFFDCLAMFDARTGVVIGDAAHGRTQLLRTTTGGATWALLPPSAVPAPLDKEGAYAASGRCAVRATAQQGYIAMGAPQSRLLVTTDAGATWRARPTPLVRTASAGMAGVDFIDANRGVAVGGDMQDTRTDTSAAAVAVTTDGGVTWTLRPRPPRPGALTGAVYVPAVGEGVIVAAGFGGVFLSTDDGQRWRTLNERPHTGITVHGRTVWVGGTNGTVLRIRF
jgi:photosystem II stability/assembly factor-like uncharacterized protein/lysophospholipase L1-like esterase